MRHIHFELNAIYSVSDLDYMKHNYSKVKTNNIHNIVRVWKPTQRVLKKEKEGHIRSITFGGWLHLSSKQK